MTCPFGSNGTFTVPAGVSLIIVDAYGAAGGSTYMAAGGHGGCAQGDLTELTADEEFRVTVGRPGGVPDGGFNGGASGGALPYPGAGGGGASDIRSASDVRLLVAGGGGGAGQEGIGSNAYGGAGGAGGGGSGDFGVAAGHGGGGGGGGTTGGGFAGHGGFGNEDVGFDGSSGSSGSGGEGGFGASNIARKTQHFGGGGSGNYYGGGGGGGGGGYFGGGGGGGGGENYNGGAGGGGGGSSYTGPASYPVVMPGCQSGAGKVLIYYGAPAQRGQLVRRLVAETIGFAPRTALAHEAHAIRKRVKARQTRRGCEDIAAYLSLVADARSVKTLTGAQARLLTAVGSALMGDLGCA